MNLIGGGFQHTKTSTLYKESKFLEWDFQTKKNPITFYVDYAILDGMKDKNDGKRKFGFMLESRSVVPGLLENIVNNLEQIEEVYESIFTHNKSLVNINSKFKWIPAYGTYIENPKINKKAKLISMITSNKIMTKNHVYRNYLANSLKNKLDLYGRGYKEIEFKEAGLEDYMFSVAVENDCYETYFTEKILDCFACGTIPVYLGSPDIAEYFNKDGIILLDVNFNIESLNDELYSSKKDAIQENFVKSLEYNVLEDWIYKKYLVGNV